MDIDRLLAENTGVVNSELARFLPKKIGKGWLRKNVGVSEYDEKAVNGFLTKPVWDFLGRGGKRWRPLLMFLSCGAVGGNPEKIRRFAVIPELIHNGTLIADDVEDSSLTRRGKPAIHVAYGVDIAVNSASLLFYLPLVIVKQSNLPEAVKVRIYELVNDELLKLHFGQGTDIYWHRTSSEAGERKYFSMCANKTGCLARLSARLGAILGNGTEKQVQSLGRFAESIGVAFQIQDDILNLKGGVGKDVGEDITEGKMSLPAIRTLTVAKRADRSMLLRILRSHTRKASEIKEAIRIITKCGSLEYSEKVAAGIVMNAWDSLDAVIPPSASKESLHKLAAFMVERKG